MSKKKPPTPVEELEQTTEEELESQAAANKRLAAANRRLTQQLGDRQALMKAFPDELPRLPRPGKTRLKAAADSCSGEWDMVVILSDCHANEQWTLDKTNGLSWYTFDRFCSSLWFLGQEIIRRRERDAPGLGLRTLHIDMLGDIYHGTLRIDDEVCNQFPSVPGIMNTAWVLWQWLCQLAPHFDQIVCTCVAGNHGRLHAKPQSKRYATENIDTLIYSMLWRFACVKEATGRITMRIPDSRQLTFTRRSHRILVAHGDHIKGGSGIASTPVYSVSRDMLRQFKKDLAKIKREAGPPLSLIEIGHFHQSNYMEDGIFINGSMCPPGPWAVDNLGASGTPKQWVYYTSDKYVLDNMCPLKLEGAAGLAHGFAYDQNILTPEEE